ncbi:Rhs family protein [Caballeronia grimmiae]|nr:Rhs family protein [Caballeronia grimmiae]
MASDTADGSTTVKISNQEVMLKNSSNFSKSAGDEAGSAPKKGVVTSKNMGKVYFNAWSMDVKFEGENVPRHLDITTHNHMSKTPGNTPPMPHISSMAMGMSAPKCEACAAAAKAGNPVNPLRGNKLLDGAEDLDFVLQGPLDLVWQRVYMSNLARVGFFGQGWITPVEMHLLLKPKQVVFVDREGRFIAFPAMKVGETYFHRQDMCTLTRVSSGAYRLEQSDGLVLTFVFQAQGDHASWQAPLVRMSDPNGNAITLIWDEHGRLQRIDGSGEHALLLDWTGERLARVLRCRKQTGSSTRGSADINALSVVVAEYEYADGDLVNVTIRGGRRTREFKWTNHMMVEHAQPGGLVCSYEWTQYDPEGKVLRSWTNICNELRFDYREQRTIVTDQDGVAEIYVADRDGHWIGYIDGKGGQYRRVLDADGHLLGTVTPTGIATKSELDERGLPVRSWDEAGQLAETKWHPILFLPTAEVDPLGRTERFSYDVCGNLLTHVLADGAATQYEYDSRGLVIAITDALGKRQSFEYDQAGRLVKETDCTGSGERLEYDEHGQLISQIDAFGNTTRYSYSPEGDLVAVTGPDGATTRYEYDCLGRLICEVEPMGGRTTFLLRPDGMLAAAIEADGQTTRYKRNSTGQLLKIENPNGATYLLEYDRVGSISRMKTFEGVEHTFGYSEDDVLRWSEEKPRTGEVIRTTYSYDPVGRPTRLATSDGQWAEFEYDAAGQLVTGRNRHSIVSFQYDAAGRRTREKLRRLDAPPASTASRLRELSGFQSGYDANGNVIHTQIPGVLELAFLRYGSGHLHQIAVDGSPYCDLERDAAHMPRLLSHQMLTSMLQYDDALQLTGIDVFATAPASTHGAAAPLIASGFQYDLNGDLLVVERSAPWGQETRKFRYDASRHIIDESGTHTPETSIHWDEASNPINARGEKIADNMVRSFDAVTASYDGFGRMNARSSPAGNARLEWNTLHQLVSARIQSNGAVHLEQYIYDAFGRRIAKVTNGREKIFQWEGERLLMEEDDRARRVFVYHDRSHEPIGFVLFPVHRADSSTTSGPVHRFLYLHNEPTGSPFALTDESGTVLWHAVLGAFGPVADHETDVDAPAEDGDASFQPLRLQGQYFDSATGLCYNRFRYYDPLIGRFISPDPIGLLGGVNAYRYAPNVLAWIDPFGLHHVTQSRIDGARREATESRSIVRQGKGQVRVQRECYLRYCTGKNEGKRVKDPITLETRRLDIVVINIVKGNVMRAVEVTSTTNVTGKEDQLDKERRIRKAGGQCIRDRKTGKLKRVPRVSRVVGRR